MCHLFSLKLMSNKFAYKVLTNCAYYQHSNFKLISLYLKWTLTRSNGQYDWLVIKLILTQYNKI